MKVIVCVFEPILPSPNPMSWELSYLFPCQLDLFYTRWSERVGKTVQQRVHSNDSVENKPQSGLNFSRIVGVNELSTRLPNLFTPIIVEKMKPDSG